MNNEQLEQQLHDIIDANVNKAWRTPVTISAYSINEQYRRFRGIYQAFSGKIELTQEEEAKVIKTFNALSKEWLRERK